MRLRVVSVTAKGCPGTTCWASESCQESVRAERKLVLPSRFPEAGHPEQHSAISFEPAFEPAFEEVSIQACMTLRIRNRVVLPKQKLFGQFVRER